MSGQPPTPDELLDAALSYAKAGLKVYPVFIRGLKPDGKKDVHVPIRSWAEMATDDLDQVRAWWDGQYAGAGIGVDMGRSHLAVADADVKDGVDGITRLATELGNAEYGAYAWTPSGGTHQWYADPDGVMGSGSNIFGTRDEPSGVDGRGVGGTIFMPPTYVPGYGRYEWADGEAPRWDALPRVPERLAAACPPGGRKKDRSVSVSAASSPAASPFAVPSAVGAGAALVTHRDRAMTRSQARARLMPLWERVRDTRSPNGLWQAVADFTRAVAHYPCFWDQAATEALLLAAYEAGGHGYTSLDGGDLRAIAGGIARQREARDTGDLDEGWVALPLAEAGDAAATAPDAVEALLAEMLTPDQVKERPPKRYLIKSLMHLDSEVWIIGPPGARKSFVVLDMAGHVAAGREWQGLKVTQGPVVIIAAEGGGGLGARVRAFEQEHGWPMPPDVHVLPRPVQAGDPAAWAVLVAACERIGPVMVIGDTQARITVGLEENSATDMGLYVNAISAMKTATGAAVVSVHHTGRSGGDARGSSAIDGAQDTELKVVACSEALTGELRVEKQKDLPERPAMPLRFKIHTVGVDEDGDPLTSLALAGATPWDAASAVPLVTETGQEVMVPEPEPWTYQLLDHNSSGNARRILQVLFTLGGQEGLTKAETERNVRERWYDGRPIRSKTTGHLDRKTWDGSWTRVMELESAGERVLFNPRGEKWAVNPAVLRALPNPDNPG